MGTLIRRPNGVYYAVFTIRGKRKWVSTRTRILDEARKVYQDLCREHESWKGMTILDFRDELLTLIDGKLAKSSVRLYAQAFKRLAEILGNLRLSSVTTYHIERFNSERLKLVSPTKVRIDFRVLRAAFNRALRYGMMERNPCLGCEKPRVPEQPPRFLTKGEVSQLLQVVADPQMRAIILLALCTAMRLGELVNLRWEDISMESGLIKLTNHEDFKLKTRKSRIVPLNQFAIAVLGGLVRTSEFVFMGRGGRPFSCGWVSRRFKRFVRKSGLSDDVHFHILRHTGATWLIQHNVPVPYVQAILGHASISTTMIYAHTEPSHLRGAVDSISPVFSAEWLN
jgi:integrase